MGDRHNLSKGFFHGLGGWQMLRSRNTANIGRQVSVRMRKKGSLHDEGNEWRNAMSQDLVQGISTSNVHDFLLLRKREHEGECAK